MLLKRHKQILNVEETSSLEEGGWSSNPPNHKHKTRLNGSETQVKERHKSTDIPVLIEQIE